MKAKTATVSKRPIEVKNGSVTVKIYEGTNHVQGNSYTQFTVVHYHGSQRVKRKFADLKTARREAETIAAQMAKGENDVLRLTAADRVVYLQAQEDLRPLNCPLNVAVSEYVNAVK
ncbi:MAG TPA: hypothetical protein VHG71_04725 [Verrucomicrobiae bacterium]|nr:hypothetical protein [Verrucomicrobiae bacterium]